MPTDRSIFLDSWAFLALANRRDNHHQAAIRGYREIVRRDCLLGLIFGLKHLMADIEMIDISSLSAIIIGPNTSSGAKTNGFPSALSRRASYP